MINYSLATENDKQQLLNHFSHYKLKEVIEKRVNNYIDNNFTVVAKDDDKIVGVLQWYAKEEPKAGLVEFEEMFVLESHRGKGIATLIVNFAIQSVKDYFKKININPRKIYLFVDKKNKSAISLYEKCGFKHVADVGFLFSDDKEDMLYELKL